MAKKQYSVEFIEQIIKETQETNNVALVARRHEIAPSTIYTWIKKKRQIGSVVSLPKAKEVRYRTMEKQLKEVSTENDRLKRLIAEKELELSILRELRDLANPSVADKAAIAQRWIKKGYSATIVLSFVGLSSSTYYHFAERIGKNNEGMRQRNKPGRKITSYTYDKKGNKIPDEMVKENLCKLIAGDGYPYGYKKLTACLQEDYNLVINHKKVYRLCKEIDILRPQRKIYPKGLS
jgi:transposase-like protein